MATADQKQRLAAALKANLKRRKARIRAMAEAKQAGDEELRRKLPPGSPQGAAKRR